MSNEIPLFSIVTVVYNGVELIEKTILSVINQDFLDKEFIIIDGGSN
jgi:glycosyltransferase involved in cell wall biosynthesis